MFQIVGIYTVIGMLFGVYFVCRGFSILDSGAKGTSIWVRMMWFPAAVALWPVLIKRLITGAST